MPTSLPASLAPSWCTKSTPVPRVPDGTCRTPLVSPIKSHRVHTSRDSGLKHQQSRGAVPVGLKSRADLVLLGLVPDGRRIDNSSPTQGGAAGHPLLYKPAKPLSVKPLSSLSNPDPTADISCLGDQPGHGVLLKAGQWSSGGGSAQTSRLPHDARVVESSPTLGLTAVCMAVTTRPDCQLSNAFCLNFALRSSPLITPRCTPDGERWWDEENGVWREVTFPAKQPGNRAQTVMLERWLTGALSRAARESMQARPDGPTVGGTGGSGGGGKSVVLVRRQMDLLVLGLGEITRQVTFHCAERGRLLDKIWRSLNDLFEYVLREMSTALADSDGRLTDLSEALEAERAERRARDAQHAHDLRTTKEELSHKWSRVVRDLKGAAAGHAARAKQNEALTELVKRWLPSFDVYKESVLVRLLERPEGAPQAARRNPHVSAEHALAADLQRLKDAGLLGGWGVWAGSGSEPEGGEVHDGSEDREQADSIAQQEDVVRSARAQTAAARLGPDRPAQRGALRDLRCESESESLQHGAGGDGVLTISLRVIAAALPVLQLLACKRDLAAARRDVADRTTELKREKARCTQLLFAAQNAFLSAARDPSPPALSSVGGSSAAPGGTPGFSTQVSVLNFLGAASLQRGSQVFTPVRTSLRRTGRISGDVPAAASAHALRDGGAGGSGEQLLRGVFEHCLARADTPSASTALLRHVVASLLFWSPPPPPPGGAPGAAPPKQPRALTSSERCMLGQLRVALGVGDPQQKLNPREGVLWLRLFGALQAHVHIHNAQHKGPVPPDLAPMTAALMCIQQVFQPTCDQVDGGAQGGGDGGNPFGILHRASLEKGMGVIRSTAAKHGGSHVEVWETMDMAIQHCWRPAAAARSQALRCLYEVADLHAEFGLSLVSVLMHVASPGLPPPVLRALCRRALALSNERGMSADGLIAATADLCLPCHGLQPLLQTEPADLAKQCAFRLDSSLHAARGLLSRAQQLPAKERADTDAAVLQARIKQVESFFSAEESPEKLWSALALLDAEVELVTACGSIVRALRAQASARMGQRCSAQRVFRRWKSAARSGALSLDPELEGAGQLDVNAELNAAAAAAAVEDEIEDVGITGGARGNGNAPRQSRTDTDASSIVFD
ncbi:hypothetical protein JKP88DRAFT_253207 [Tribonema minus]|uniref:Uncharacterized protein n=1 Tax=Tribonema minus TaxID=303371 RepID=A0A835Z723_9STRA|nr:hypothetical protein JKP88DRAFT_253207 [Tribonema minus]